MEILKASNTVLTFLLELAMLVAFGYWGFQSGQGSLLRWASAAGLPLATAVIWGVFFAPKASQRLSLLPGTMLSLGMFLLAALALYQAKQPTAAIAFAAAAIANRALALLWRQW